MNKGKALISASWQKLETLIPDLTFIDGSKYLFQVQGESKVRFLESDTEPTATDENGILTSETGFPVKLTKESGQDIYVKTYGSGAEKLNTYVNIELLEA